MDSTLPMKPSDRPSSRPGSEAPKLRRKPVTRRSSAAPLTDEPVFGFSSKEPSSRIAAAQTLETSENPDAYNELLEALEGEDDRGVQMAVLKALDTLGGKTADRKIIPESGFGPLQKFVRSNLDDSKLVEAGLKALQWTCDIKHLMNTLDQIRDTTEDGSKTNIVATRFMGSILTER